MEMDINDYIDSKYLKSSDLKGRQDIPVVISHVDEEMVGMGRDIKKKLVAYFIGKEKGVPLNVTNMRTLAAAYGNNPRLWQGKPALIFTVRTQKQDGTPTDGIRLRPGNPVPDPNMAPAVRPSSSEISPPDDMNDDIPW